MSVPQRGFCSGGSALIVRPLLARIRPAGIFLECRILAPAPVYRGERSIWLEVEAPDVGVAAVRGALAGVLQRSKGSPNRAPHRGELD